MIGGYLRRVLHIDLSTMKVEEETLGEDVLKTYLGGYGLGVKLLCDELPPDVDALGPENRLIIVTGPLVGTAWPGSCQYAALAKSPLTGLLGLARSKGFFAAELKFAGYDGIIIRGVAEKPIYLWIHDRQIELVDATSLWGKDCFTTENLIQKNLDDSKTRVVCIGPAGETLSRMACLMNDHGHAAARCGIGAVMGSKQLKAIAVRGTGEIPVVHQKTLSELRKKWFKLRSEAPASRNLGLYGTAGNYERTETRNLLGDLPTKNWTLSTFSDWRKLSGQYMKEKYPTKKTSCFRCPVGHDYLIEIPSGSYRGTYVYPEYEQTAAFGCNIGNSDTEAMIKLSDIANRYGMDAIECSHVLSLVMECYERGMVKSEDMDGLELTWGNIEATIQLLEKIVKREGIGDILAEGVKRAAAALGATELAIEIKGMSPVLHDLRHHWGWLISYLVAPAGPTHMGSATATAKDPDLDFHDTGAFTPKGKGKAAKLAHMRWLGLDCLGVCVFTSFNISLKLHLEALSAVTGWEMTVKDLTTCIERSVTLSRQFNINQGLSPKDDWPSERILEPPVDGPAKGVSPLDSIQSMLEEYYQEMGWDPKTGKPSMENNIE